MIHCSISGKKILNIFIQEKSLSIDYLEITLIGFQGEFDLYCLRAPNLINIEPQAGDLSLCLLGDVSRH